MNSNHASEIAIDLHLGFPGTDFDLSVQATVPATGITAIYGASGSGKTTLLRCLAGLQTGVQGSLRLGNHIWQGADNCLPAHRRPVGYVFQEASLFEHLDVAGNLAFAERRASGEPVVSKSHLLDLLGITHLLSRRSQQLSGGERQRVAIARALLINPRLLLMDEPLAALDTARKREILPYLEALHEELQIPVLYVTHSLEEVARLADYLLVLEAGRVREQGPLAEVLSKLDSPLQADEDSGTVLQGRIAEKDATWHLASVAFDGGELWLPDTGDDVGDALRLRILARDVSLSLTDNRDSSIVNRLPCEVEEIAADDSRAMALVSLSSGQTRLLARVSRRSVHELKLAPGQTVWAQIKSVAILR